MKVVSSAKNEEKKETPAEAKARRESVTFIPRKSGVLVDILDIKPRVSSSIIMPEGKTSADLTLKSYNEHPLQAIVVALGPDCGKMPLGNTGLTSADDIAVGDRIAFRNIGAAAHGVVLDGFIYTLMNDHDIIGILEKA